MRISIPNRAFAACLLALCSALAPHQSNAQTAPTLGQAASFGVLAGSAVTNTGPTNILGDLGVSPGAAVSGFPPGLISGGAIHANDAVAQTAKSDLVTAYNTLASEASNATLTGVDLGGLTLTSGVYTFASSAQLTGTLTLDAQGNSAAVFVFQIGSTLTTASNAKVVVINGGANCNVFWQVGSSATLGTTTSFVGNILALSSITLNTGSTVSGRILARNGAVTLDSNSVALCTVCSALAITPAVLPPATVGVAYSQTITATGSAGPYTYSVVSGALPPGITLSNSGVVSGIASGTANATVTIRAISASSCSGDVMFTLVVNAATCSAISLSPATLPQASVGVAYSQQLSASGGTGPYTYAVIGGALPSGLQLNGSGLISGIPTFSGNQSFSIRVTDAAGCSTVQSFTLSIAPGACSNFTLTPATLPTPMLGVAYSANISVSGNTSPVIFSLSGGALPGGLSMHAVSSSAAQIFGTAVSSQAYSFSISAKDVNGCPAQRTFSGSVGSITPADPAPTLGNYALFLFALAIAALGLAKNERAL